MKAVFLFYAMGFLCALYDEYLVSVAKDDIALNYIASLYAVDYRGSSLVQRGSVFGQRIVDYELSVDYEIFNISMELIIGNIVFDNFRHHIEQFLARQDLDPIF